VNVDTSATAISTHKYTEISLMHCTSVAWWMWLTSSL